MHLSYCLCIFLCHSQLHWYHFVSSEYLRWLLLFLFLSLSSQVRDLRLLSFLMTITKNLLFTFRCFSLCTPDIVISSLLIKQSPVHVLIKPEQVKAHFGCYHGDNNYPYMLWYRSAAGGRRDMELIGLLHYENANLEKNFEARCNMTGHSKGRAELLISNVKPADSAVYFCAASQHSATDSSGSFTKSLWPTASNVQLHRH